MNLSGQVVRVFGWLSQFFLAFLMAGGLTGFFELAVSYYRMRGYAKSLRFIDHRRFLDSEHIVPVSILMAVPADSQDAQDALESLLALDFSEYEIIVAIYGGLAGLSKPLLDSFQLLPFQQPYKRSLPTGELQRIYRSARDFRLTVLEKPDGDRADALNACVNLSSYPVVVTLDPDAALERDALIRIVYAFVSDPQCVAVCGAARVACEEPQNWLERRPLECMQRTERVRALYTSRIGTERTGFLASICDSFVAFKKSAVLEAGGFHTQTAGEEGGLLLDIQARMRRNGRRYATVFLPDPICTVCPLVSIREVCLQRRCWHAALKAALSRHGRAAFGWPAKQTGAGGLLFFWLSDIAAPVLETLGLFVVPAAWLLGSVDGWFVLLYFSLSVLLGTALSVSSVLLEENIFPNTQQTGLPLWLFVYSFAENLGYRQIARACRIGWPRDRTKAKGKPEKR
ncbi:MAG: glycosyltransferase family 2 protein [Eubacteriales bacterium]|nr:glycosyltransferase family 2 protein [Eubacteriales bacterium]